MQRKKTRREIYDQKEDNYSSQNKNDVHDENQ